MDATFWEEVERSRQMTPEQRFMATLDLIDLVRELNLAGIRSQFPGADEDRVDEIFMERRQLARRLESMP